jgi:hypothetical protein
MKDESQTPLNHTDASHTTSPMPHSQSSDSQLPSIPTIVPSEYTNGEVSEERAQKGMRNVIIVVVAVVIIGLAFFISLIVATSEAYNTKDAASKSGGGSSSIGSYSEGPSGKNSISKTSPNPATGSASIGAEGKYCSNPVNAVLSC